MIKDEFICLKYKGVMKMSEIMKSPNTAVNFGWKCRKYINWADIQSEKDDRKTLKAFGDDLIDNNHLDVRYFGAISRMFYKVQQWKLDKNNFSIEPATRLEWDYLYTLINNSVNNPDIIILFLNDYKVDSNGLSKIEIQNIFYFIPLVEYFQKSLPDVNIGYSINNIDKIDNKLVLKTVGPYYEHFGLILENNENVFNMLQNIYADLGILNLTQHKDLNLEPKIISKQQISFIYKQLDRTTFINIKNHKNSILVEVNSRNKYVNLSLKENSLKSHFETFLKAYVLTISELPELQKSLNTLNAYLALKLDQIEMDEV